ncbi:type IV secretory system conjugative DNA transfer family protein [Campylobacter coli]|nr:type IV secretory system conjugative DNA transfer family protein [Campylobacter coli]
MKFNIDKLEYVNFAKEEEFEEMGIVKGKNKEGICFGETNRKIEIKANNPNSVLLMAEAGTGSVSTFITPNLLKISNSSIVLDFEREIYDKTSEHRKKHLNNEILLFEPFSDDNTLFFNPFDNSIIENMNLEELSDFAFKIAKAIFDGNEIGIEKDLFVLFILHNCKNIFLSNLSKISLNFEQFLDFLEKIKNNNSDVVLIKHISKIQKKIKDEKEYVKAYKIYNSVMKIFDNSKIANFTSKMNFRFEDFVEKKVTAYLSIPYETKNIELFAPVARVFIETLYIKLRQKSNSDFIYLYFNQFLTFGKNLTLLERLETAPSKIVPILITNKLYEKIQTHYSEIIDFIENRVKYFVVYDHRENDKVYIFVNNFLNKPIKVYKNPKS